MTNIIVVVVVSAWILAIVAFTCFVFPRQLEREGFGRLSRNIRARLSFAILNLTIGALIIVISLLLYFPTGIILLPMPQEILEKLDSSHLNDTLANNYLALFLSATTAFFTLFSSHRWRRLEARVLHKLNNLSFVEQDKLELANTLKTHPFEGSFSARDRAFEAFDWLQRRSSSRDADEPGRSLATMAKKVEALLEIWNDNDWVATLPHSEVPSREVAVRSHDRRKSLALEVRRCIESIDNGEADSRDLHKIVGAMETPPVSEETNGRLPLQDIIGRLVTFLVDGYKDQLADLSSITAKAVIVSGDDANRRLGKLKDAGFVGIGKVEIIDLDRLVAIAGGCMIVIGLAVFASRAIEKIVHNEAVEWGDGVVILVVVFSLTMAFVIGTMVGSLRRLAKKPNPSWSLYLLCAITAVILHMCIFGFSGMLSRLTMQSSITENEHFIRSFYGVGLLSFFIVLGICRLSHDKIHPRGRTQFMRDAAILAGVLIAAGTLFIIIVKVGKLTSIRLPFGPEALVFVVPMVSVLLGCVGAYVVRTVRRAANSSYVKDDIQSAVEYQEAGDMS